MRGLSFKEDLIFEKSREGAKGYSLPKLDVPKADPAKTIDKKFLREGKIGLPEVSEVDVIRHFTKISLWNYAVDYGLYPLGSCTMKYNPKINEITSSLPGFADAHPYQPYSISQGALELMYNLEKALMEITGFSRVSLHPAAGAHGELVGMMLIRRYLEDQGNPRKKVLIPDSAHGTNPASAAICGYEAVELKSNSEGMLSLSDLEAALDKDVAALMLTNPNTLGVFEKNIKKICEMVHKVGGQVYMDGANMNALMGIMKPGKSGVDVLHLNLHKTFSTPHGGGGPGSGPVAVAKHLAPYIPKPVIEKNDKGEFYLDYNPEKSIGRVRSFNSNFAILVRAYTYILSCGSDGLKESTEHAVANANYIRKKLSKYYDLPYETSTLHEIIFSDKIQEKFGVTTKDIAKRLLDLGYHPPTIYFPLIVHGALMIEPTESESKQELDGFIEAMIQIAQEAEKEPEKCTEAPHNTVVGRLDEVTAARTPILKWEPEKE
ncbi:MAG: aminomethyl-transferring glycine dehydrogenase subunit GcvPB [Acidobacteria bacterium]|nr:aminomethyl-transferring glycine dehydrogenase subunit GcvPB [Acidobacteriota bacterium]